MYEGGKEERITRNFGGQKQEEQIGNKEAD